jgi:hypothetical protein
MTLELVMNEFIISKFVVFDICLIISRELVLGWLSLISIERSLSYIGKSKGIKH